MMLTHRWSGAIAAHFARLRAEAGAVLPVYLAFSLPADAPLPEGCAPDIVIRPSDAVRRLPARAAYARHHGDWTGSADRFSMPAMLGPLRAFDWIWFLEYDVDYSGDWGDFFRQVETMRGDYVATHIRSRDEDPLWPHWQSFAAPPAVEASSHRASFHPIARFSRRMIEAHVRAVEREGWTGHTEAIYPSLAAHLGFAVIDLGGAGRFVPAGWTERFYDAPEKRDMLSESFGYRPPVATSYFHEDPSQFPARGRLLHPIKKSDADGPPDLLMDLPAGWQQTDVRIDRERNMPLDPSGEAPSPPLSVQQRIGREIRRLGRQIGWTRR